MSVSSPEAYLSSSSNNEFDEQMDSSEEQLYEELSGTGWPFSTKWVHFMPNVLDNHLFNAGFVVFELEPRERESSSITLHIVLKNGQGVEVTRRAYKMVINPGATEDQVYQNLGRFGLDNNAQGKHTVSCHVVYHYDDNAENDRVGPTKTWTVDIVD